MAGAGAYYDLRRLKMAYGYGARILALDYKGAEA